MWASRWLLVGALWAALQASTVVPRNSWRVQEIVAAPWSQSEQVTSVRLKFVGTEVIFGADRVLGPRPVACDQARFDYVLMPAEGFFQGGLDAPADAAARALGMSGRPLLTLAINCSTGLYDYHFDNPQQLRIALDNLIWTLGRVPDDAPESVLQALFVQHYNHDAGFTQASVALKVDSFSRGLQSQIAVYFAQDFPQDEVPPIDGDPFSNSQEYPERLRIGVAAINGDRASVSVQFFFEPDQQHTVSMLMLREQDGWRIDDLVYESGGRLSQLLQLKGK